MIQNGLKNSPCIKVELKSSSVLPSWYNQILTLLIEKETMKKEYKAENCMTFPRAIKYKWHSTEYFQI